MFRAFNDAYIKNPVNKATVIRNKTTVAFTFTSSRGSGSAGEKIGRVIRTERQASKSMAAKEQVVRSCSMESLFTFYPDKVLLYMKAIWSDQVIPWLI